MQIEAEILSVKVRLDRKCKNYAIRVIGLSEKHPRISGKQRLFHTTPQYSTELGLNLKAPKYLN